MALQFIDQIDVSGKKALVRCDFNVPLKNGEILDTTRIDLALPTIKYLIENKASKIVLMSHLGRPKGEVNKDLSLEPVADYLAEKLGKSVVLTESAVKNGIKELLTLPDIKILLLENLRFHKEETANDESFAKELAEYGDIYINEAFGAAHRKHASVHSVIKFFPRQAYAGFLMKKEIESLDKLVNSKKKPSVGIIGGAKVSDKIKTIEKLMVSADKILIGGAMAYPFLKQKGFNIGKSLCSDEDVTLAQSILRRDTAGKITLPVDHLTSKEFGGSPIECNSQEIPEDEMGLDIGSKTIEQYSNIIGEAKTIFWNGPMGLFENQDFANGTMKVCEAVANNSGAYSLVGGGDSVSAVKKSGLDSSFSHVSSGGGASLEYIENSSLPGISALKFGVN